MLKTMLSSARERMPSSPRRPDTPASSSRPEASASLSNASQIASVMSAQMQLGSFGSLTRVDAIWLDAASQQRRPMRAFTFVLADGRRAAIDPDVVESVRPSVDGVLVRFLTGDTQIVKGPYLQVLELLAIR